MSRYKFIIYTDLYYNCQKQSEGHVRLQIVLAVWCRVSQKRNLAGRCINVDTFLYNSGRDLKNGEVLVFP